MQWVKGKREGKREGKQKLERQFQSFLRYKKLQLSWWLINEESPFVNKIDIPSLIYQKSLLKQIHVAVPLWKALSTLLGADGQLHHSLL